MRSIDQSQYMVLKLPYIYNVYFFNFEYMIFSLTGQIHRPSNQVKILDHRGILTSEDAATRYSDRTISTEKGYYRSAMIGQ